MAEFLPTITLADLDGSDGFRLNGGTPRGWTGASVSSAGDINGDGIDDIVIGAPNMSPDGRTNAGTSFIVFGSKSGFPGLVDTTALDGTNGFALHGDEDFDRAGTAVSSAGDFNNDGFDDLLIGAPKKDLGRGVDNKGASYIVFGKEDGFEASKSLGSLDGSDGFRINGEHEWGLSGHALANIGDINSDGYSDIILGAPEVTTGRGYPSEKVQAGTSHVLYGNSDDTPADIELRRLWE